MYKNQTKTLLNTIKNTINFRLLDLTENLFLKTLSLENSSFNANTQTQILDPTINISELLENSIVPFFTLDKKIFFVVLFVLVSLHQFANGTDTFVVSYFVFSFVSPADH